MKLIVPAIIVAKTLFVLVILVSLKFILKCAQRGFICGDPSLSLNRKPDTVSNLALVLWGTSPVIMVMLGDMIFNFDQIGNVKSCFKRSWKNVKFLIHRYLIDTFLMYIIIIAVKYFAGAHRPSFFETCLPDTMFNCTLGTFVPSFTCTNTAVSTINRNDASMSFFSGHAATCFFSCFFVIWYLEKRMKSHSLFFLLFLQTALICLSCYGSISRVFDHRHHWWDVLTGAIFGLLVAYHTCYILCKNKYYKPDQPQLPTDINSTFIEPRNKITNNIQE